ncbi:hypothetical protein LOAG_10711, partial [Loa loa]
MFLSAMVGQTDKGLSSFINNVKCMLRHLFLYSYCLVNTLTHNIHTHTHTHAYTPHTDIHTRTHTRAHTRIHTHTHTHTHTCDVFLFHDFCSFLLFTYVLRKVFPE